MTFMLKHLELAGCKFTPASIQCYPCPEDLAAQSGFHPDYGVMLCQNRTHLPTKAYAESALTHELMHAFDYCRFKMDFNNVRHHACSEVSVCRLHLEAYPVLIPCARFVHPTYLESVGGSGSSSGKSTVSQNTTKPVSRGGLLPRS